VRECWRPDEDQAGKGLFRDTVPGDFSLGWYYRVTVKELLGHVNPTTFWPVVINPGSSATVNVTIRPSVSSGTLIQAPTS